MDTVDPLRELYKTVLKDIWLLIQLNNYRYDGIVYLPKDDNERSLLFRLGSTDHVLTISNPESYPPKFAKILATIKPGSFILDIIAEKFNKLCKEYEISNDQSPNMLKSRPSKRELQKTLTHILKANDFSKLEEKLLRYLSRDFKPHTQTDIVNEVGECDFGHLVKRTRDKIRGKGFNLLTTRAQNISGKSTYYLNFID